MRTLTVEEHQAFEMPVVCAPTPRKKAQVAVCRLSERAQADQTPQFRDSGFLRVERAAPSEDLEPGTLVKIQFPTKMFLGAVAARKSGSAILEIDLSAEYTPR